jgi:hypothetical protein
MAVTLKMFRVSYGHEADTGQLNLSVCISKGDTENGIAGG